MIAATRCELEKLVRSPVGLLTAAALVVGVSALCAVILSLAGSGDEALTAKLGSSASFEWSGLFSVAAQITGAGGFIACGVLVGWIFAREFADGTITGFFASPISRGTIALGKTLAVAAWLLIASLLLVSLLLILGLILGFGMPHTAEVAAAGRQYLLILLTGAVVLPVGWVASVTRSLLAAVGTAIGLVVVAQIGVLTGAGGWLPFSAPALWAISAGTAVNPGQLAIAILVGVLSTAATTITWDRLQLDR